MPHPQSQPENLHVFPSPLMFSRAPFLSSRAKPRDLKRSVPGTRTTPPSQPEQHSHPTGDYPMVCMYSLNSHPLSTRHSTNGAYPGTINAGRQIRHSGNRRRNYWAFNRHGPQPEVPPPANRGHRKGSHRCHATVRPQLRRHPLRHLLQARLFQGTVLRRRSGVDGPLLRGKRHPVRPLRQGNHRHA